MHYAYRGVGLYWRKTSPKACWNSVLYIRGGGSAESNRELQHKKRICLWQQPQPDSKRPQQQTKKSIVTLKPLVVVVLRALSQQLLTQKTEKAKTALHQDKQKTFLNNGNFVKALNEHLCSWVGIWLYLSTHGAIKFNCQGETLWLR